MIKVIVSPYEEDKALPWEYEDHVFIQWVHEVFLEGYKRDVPVPSVEEAIDIVLAAGYWLETS